MSFEYGANYADVICFGFVQNTCLSEMEEFLFQMDKTNTTWYELVYDTPPEEVETAYEALIKAFKKKTGLVIVAMYVDEDDTLGGAEITGQFFHVENVYQVRPKVKPYIDYINRCFWVTGG